MPRYTREQLAAMARAHLAADQLLDMRPYQVSVALQQRFGMTGQEVRNRIAALANLNQPAHQATPGSNM